MLKHCPNVLILAQLVDKVLEYQNELSSIEMEEVFIKCFSLAVSLLFEAISKD